VSDEVTSGAEQGDVVPTTEPTASEPAGSRPRISPRVLYVAGAIVAVTLGLGLTVSLLMRPEGGVDLAGLPADRSVTVNVAGSFPPPGEDPLANPLGIAIDGGRVYVAEADAGRIQVFDLRGGRYGDIRLATAGGALTAYPTSLAATGDGRLAVVDGAAGKVLVVDAQAGDATILMTLGEAQANTAPVQPTAVAYSEDSFYVSDGISHTIKIYGEDGRYQGELGAAVRPALTYPGGLAIVDGEVVLADSNAGRVLAMNIDSGAARDFPDRYSLPRGVARVQQGVAVCDVFSAAVYVCDSSGTRTHSIDSDSVPESPLETPEGVAWAQRSERLYVTDAASGKVVVFNVRI